jgi:protein Tex
MEKTHFIKVAGELKIAVESVKSTVGLLDEGATVPFISRYRKEMTGSLDEVQITSIRDRIIQLRDLDKRREAILKSLKEQSKLTKDLEDKVNKAETMTALEDIYLPYKPKRRTRATIAKERGLEPIATLLFAQDLTDINGEASKLIDPGKELNSIDEVLAGARDIMAEWINENAEVRSKVRKLFLDKGIVVSKVMKGKEEAGIKYKDYFEWSEPLGKTPSHRMLAMRRGEKELFLMLDIAPAEEDAMQILAEIFVKGRGPAAEQVKLAAKDSYKRLLRPSLETEVRLLSKQKADEEAIKVFADNLKQLLLSAPLGQKNILALDPGFKSGCKVVCLDRQGKLMFNDNIYPHEPQREVAKAGTAIKKLCETYQIEAIAIGNGTASRETENFVKALQLPASINIMMVNESGASVYSASDVAREEFPDKDVTVRGAVSIGRRLMDPLAELVKIDPKSIGVGQYQHDVDQNALKGSLDDVVMSSVNAVGVEVNTASKQLLSYVSGLGPQLAQNIVEYRNENGPFQSREALKKVPRLGDKAFEQAAGFLRIRDGKNPLDGSAVHPERYNVVESMAKDLGTDINTLIKNKEIRAKIHLKNYVNENLGLPTLNDILNELNKPGRDPREEYEAFQFADGIEKMGDLRPGMKLPGIVTNITKFGAFVDIGVHQDGLVHISHLSNRFISDPSEAVKVYQKVQVSVLEVDVERKRISLSMKDEPSGRTNISRPKEKKKKEEPEESMEQKLNKLKGMFK